MTKAEEKRAAIVAQQEARELAEREAKQASGVVVAGRRPGAKVRTNWAASPPLERRRGRPPTPRE